MRLSGDFFHITKLDNDNGESVSLLEINASHKIFEGHFPGQPVVPGVCMMQMVKEIIEKVVGRKTRIANADNLKFLTIIDPTKNKNIRADLKYTVTDDGKINVSASFTSGTVTYFKMSGIFIFEENE